jgi:hypothetical protein
MLKNTTLILLLIVFNSCGSSEDQSSSNLKNMSADCKIFLEDYSMEVAGYLAIQKNIELNGDDMNLIIARNSSEESITALQSDPGLFNCISNTSFKSAIDSLNSLMEY